MQIDNFTRSHQDLNLYQTFFKKKEMHITNFGELGKDVNYLLLLTFIFPPTMNFKQCLKQFGAEAPHRCCTAVPTVSSL